MNRHHSLPYLVNCSLMFTEVPLLRRLAGLDCGLLAAKAEGLGCKVIIEVIMERVTNISKGTELDNVTEFEDLAARREDAPTAVVSMPD